jgi:xanthine dehydrogenase molybdopterin-binding subunit B
LHAELILSSQAHAYIMNIDTTQTMKVSGVIKVITAKDIEILGGSNVLGPIAHDESIFIEIGKSLILRLGA